MRKSLIWRYFTENGKTCACVICGEILQFYNKYGSTSNLWRHLKRHRLEYENLKYECENDRCAPSEVEAIEVTEMEQDTQTRIISVSAREDVVASRTRNACSARSCNITPQVHCFVMTSQYQPHALPAGTSSNMELVKVKDEVVHQDSDDVTIKHEPLCDLSSEYVHCSMRAFQHQPHALSARTSSNVELGMVQEEVKQLKEEVKQLKEEVDHQNSIDDPAKLEPPLDLSTDDPLTQEEAVNQDNNNQPAIRELKKYLETLERYYVFADFVKTEIKNDGKTTRTVHTGNAQCMQDQCTAKGKKGLHSFSTQSRYHLKVHYEKIHKAMVPELSAAMEGLNKRGRSKSRESYFPSKRRPMCIEETMAQKKFSKENGRKVWTKWFIDTMLPISITEHPSTREMMAVMRPEFTLPSRRTLGRELDTCMERARSNLITTLYGVKIVATTADSWTAHNRVFLGMTVHWIDKATLKRVQGTLACKEIKESLKHQLMAHAMYDIYQDFGLAGKVTATTTDNGTNYVSAFKHYAADEVPLEDPEEEEEDPDVVVGVPADLQAKLEREAAEAGLELPPHRRCSAHTANLLATADVAVVPGWNHGPSSPWIKAVAKAQVLWNIQHRSSVTANQIEAAINRKLTTPVKSRWNSFYDCVKVLLEALDQPAQLEAINSIITSQSKGSFRFNDIDVQVLTEYRDVMEPVASCLNRLQGRETAYMGILLPNLHIMRTLLERQRDSGNLQYAKPLVEALLGCFEDRFGRLYEDMDIVMATALHPHYTPAILRKVAPDNAPAVKTRIVRELNSIIESELAEEESDPSQPRRKDIVDLLMDDEDALGDRKQDLDEVLNNAMRSWKRTHSEDPLTIKMFPIEHREAWVDMFIKYNTALPSSAAVEMLFSVAGDILRPKRASLMAHNFEQLVFLRGNMKLMGYKDLEPNMEDENEEVMESVG